MENKIIKICCVLLSLIMMICTLSISTGNVYARFENKVSCRTILDLSKKTENNANFFTKTSEANVVVLAGKLDNEETITFKLESPEAETKGKFFLNSPNAIEGNEVSKCDTSSAEFQSKNTGLIDAVGSEEELLEEVRALVCMLPANNEDDASYDECLDNLNRVCDGIETVADDAALLATLVSDEQIFFETKREYAKDMVTGFIRLNGMTVGVVANRSKVFDEEGNVAEELETTLSEGGCKKATDFVEFCDAFNIPIATFTNVTGFQACKCAEKRLARESAKLTYAFANATVPKVNVVVGKAFGSAYITMNSKSIGADMVYAWPNSEIGMMDANLAAKIMYAGEDAATIKEQADTYQALQVSPMSAARRGYVDTIIEPKDTRKYLIGAFEMLFTKREDRPSKKHGTV
mgnify:CR=1 FL=1